MSFALPADAALLTGDTVLGRGTTVVAHPDGELGDYLDSLERLRALTGDGAVDAHPARPRTRSCRMPPAWSRSTAPTARERLEQVRAARRWRRTARRGRRAGLRRRRRGCCGRLNAACRNWTTCRRPGCRSVAQGL